MSRGLRLCTLCLALLLAAAGARAQQEISSLSEITNANGNYRLTGDASGTPGVTTFSGTLDGGYHTISGLSAPLFTTLNGGTVKNVRFKDVGISGETVGAVCGTAQGSAKIYNCGVLGGSVSGTTNAGGLVGLISQNSNVRVVNCYNYASISGGNYAAGIVGRNRGTISGTTTVNTTGVRITNCMMYGDLTSGTNRSPVYGGNHTDNVQKLTEYNYYRSRANLTYTAYNDQLAIDKDVFLTRFPFYRHIQNTHRELAAYFLFGTGNNAPSAAQVAEIGHWVLDTEVAPYPIIEEWKTNTKKTTVDIAANLPTTSEDFAGKKLTEMGSSGSLTVNVSINGSSYSCELPITDMDTLCYDFTWGKVVLPFANEFEGWTRDYSKICTGWKITSVSGGKTGTLENYNFADRDCTAKDIYNATTNPYIFAQGGNYIVPYGVKSISIEANFANAFYLSDAQADFGYNNGYGGQTNLAYQLPTTYHGRTVYTDLSTLVGEMSNGTNPHAQAIVLVGNYHYNQNVVGQTPLNTAKACTIMSVDEDNNQEPDYGWYSYHTKDRTPIPPMRFDFVPNIGMGMAERVTGSTPYPTIGIWHSRGWFEQTETCVSFMSECEINDGDFSAADNGYGNNRWIANSGYFIQIVRARSGNANKLSYLQIGGNAYVEELYPGSHTDNARVTTIRPIVVTGGEIEECYMTGYRAGATATGSDIYFWGAGGRIHKWLGAYMENPNTAGVNVTAKIDHARIWRFFGGGTSGSARITGNIDITMNNSLVDFYCGGPEFGDMAAGKTVTTHAKGSTFGEYYGAGFGGTSITYHREGNNASVNFGNNVNFPIAFSDTYKRLTNNTTYGIGSCYKFEFILYSGGSGTGVARSYTGYAKFDLATTGSVTNALEGCTVKGNYYGAGCQGKVNGTVKSTLTGCTFEGSVFGGGYKAASNTLDVYPATEPTKSRYTKETGLFSDFGTVAPETFTWQSRATTGSDDANKILYTTTNMTQLGNVTGAISLTVDGGTVAGNVYGGGNESPSRDNTTVLVKGDANVAGSTFGGGNKAVVDGSVAVTIDGTAIIGQDVYGGGALAETNQKDANQTTRVTLQGGTVQGNLYGGGLGQLNGTNGATEDVAADVGGAVTVTVNGGKAGNVFGCNNLNGAPQQAVGVLIAGTDTPQGDATYAVGNVYGGGNVAPYTGNPTVTMTGGFVDNLFGGGLGATAVVTGATSVTLQGGTVADDVYGGGSMANVTADVGVTIGGGTVKGSVYGGGALAHTNTNGQTNIGSLTATELATTVALHGGTIVGNVYGGGLGRLAAEGVEAVKALVAGGVTVTLNPATDTDNCVVQGDIFGCNNLNGTPLGSTLVHIYKTQGWSAEEGAKDHDVTEGKQDDSVAKNTGKYELHAVYGGGNLAAYEPTDAFSTVEATKKAATTHVIIEGCDLTSIGTVYGGGNAASVPATQVEVKSCYEIGSLFGGGNGFDALPNGDPNPGANVGYKAYPADADYDTRNSDAYTYGSGEVNATIKGGSIHYVYGGSNTKGNVRIIALTMLDEGGDCAFRVDEVYGGGKEAPMDGKAELIMACIPGLESIYGGAMNADVNNDVELTITNGTFGQVFGGNNMGGRIMGSITVNVEETGCRPVIIGELYGGGNLAPYSIYGYKKLTKEVTVTDPDTGGETTEEVEYWAARESNTDNKDADGMETLGADELFAPASPFRDPSVNVISCTSIGRVFGGGLGKTAVMVGNPTVSINEVYGRWYKNTATGDNTQNTGGARVTSSVVAAGTKVYGVFEVPEHQTGELGSIGTVFGGGNAADVIGNTQINIGTEETVKQIVLTDEAAGTLDYETDGSIKRVDQKPGANIKNDVFGGGNVAKVTGSSNIVIGQ